MFGRHQLRVDSTLENLPKVGEFVSLHARNAGLDEEAVFAVEMAVDEACTNVIEHAYEGRPGEEFEISCELEGDDFVITIHDHGQPFDPSNVPVPDLSCPLEERRIGGLGVYFMHRLMDSVTFEFDEDEGNTLTMIKSRITGLPEGKPLC